jgi:hypothetical protein
MRNLKKRKTVIQTMSDNKEVQPNEIGIEINKEKLLLNGCFTPDFYTVSIT